MSSSQRLDNKWRPAEPSDASRGNQRDYWKTAVTFVILGALTFNFILAFVNTNVTGIRESHVILAELVLISCALCLVLDKKAEIYVLLAIYLSYMALIMALRPELDLKAIRDALIPIIFYCIGRKLHRIEDADRIVFVCAYVVLAVGLFEFLMLDVFTSVINVFNYYVARGSLSADSNFVEGSNLFISSTRMGGRNFLPFLGSIRASSVFLEPVTMGNFGAFLCLWAVFRNSMAYRWLLLSIGFMIIILGDARFGLFVTFSFILVLPIYKLIPRSVLWLAPFCAALTLGLYGSWTSQVAWEDNLPGRILHSGLIMNELDWQAVFGIATGLPFVDDNGYAYSLSQLGIIGCGFLWALFVYSGPDTDDVHRYKVLATVFICLLLVVSNSIYTIKLAALFWLVAGAADLTPTTSPDHSAESLDSGFRAKMSR